MLWKSVAECFVQNVHMQPNEYIELTEEQERQEKLGKFAEEKPDYKALALDPKSKKTVKIGNKHLVKAKRSDIEGIEGKPMEEGMILYPPPRNPVSVGESKGGEINATVFQTRR